MPLAAVRTKSLAFLMSTNVICSPNSKARRKDDSKTRDMMTVKRIDANTLEIVNKKDGKVMTTQRNVVAADGKTRTVTTTGTDAQGQKVNNITVFEKQ